MLWQTPVVVPSRYKDHVVPQVFALNLRFLEHNNIGLENFEHAVESPLVPPWLVSKWIANAIDVPGGDPDAHDGYR